MNKIYYYDLVSAVEFANKENSDTTIKLLTKEYVLPEKIEIDNEVFKEGLDELKKVVKYIRIFGISDKNFKVESTLGLDDVKFYESYIDNGKANIPYSKLSQIKYGNHLVKAEFLNTSDGTISYTYATLFVDKITPIIHYEEDFLNNLIKGEESTLTVSISASDKEISGFVNIYLDDELINYQYLYGNEGYYGIIDNYNERPYTIDDITPIEGYTNTIKFIIKMPILPIALPKPSKEEVALFSKVIILVNKSTPVLTNLSSAIPIAKLFQAFFNWFNFASNESSVFSNYLLLAPALVLAALTNSWVLP